MNVPCFLFPHGSQVLARFQRDTLAPPTRRSRPCRSCCQASCSISQNSPQLKEASLVRDLFYPMNPNGSQNRVREA